MMILKKKIKENKYLYDRVLFVKKVGINKLFVNFIFQRLFRLNSKLSTSVHFTSTLIGGQKIKYNKDLITRVSFAVSGHCYIQALNGVKFGKNFLFAPGLKVISANHDLVDNNILGSGVCVDVGDNVWAGANVTILPQVKIGDNCIIGAGAVVTKSFGSNLIIGGNPAKVIRER